MSTDRTLVLELLNALDTLLGAHGFLSDPECNSVECECSACIDARALLARIASEGEPRAVRRVARRARVSR